MSSKIQVVKSSSAADASTAVAAGILKVVVLFGGIWFVGGLILHSIDLASGSAGPEIDKTTAETSALVNEFLEKREAAERRTASPVERN
ncbi:MAG: hypothetical protein ACRC4X_05375 [Cetobacterium sp.]